jgi:putative addiction module CopG family antidote
MSAMLALVVMGTRPVKVVADLVPVRPCAMVAGMNVTIPPEFEAFAREQIEAGTFTSEEEAVATALHDYLARLKELRALIDEGFESGAPVDARTVFDRTEAELEAMIASEGNIAAA